MKEGEIGKTYSDGEIIFKEGEKGDRMYVIQSGKVKITKETPSGEVVIAVLESGEFFGEMALFSKQPRCATARVLGNTRILSVDKKKLFSTISSDPTLVFKLLESMSERLRKIDDEFATLKKSKFDVLHICIDIDEICNLILEEAKNIITADSGSIMLLDEEQEMLLIRAAFGSESEPKVRFSLGKGIAGDVLRTGRSELVNKVSIDPRFIPGAKRIQSLICIPLKWREHVFGVINMSNSTDKLFSLDNLKLLHSLSIYASIALQNAMGCSKLKSATEEVLRHATILDIR